jgi:hypothetical protein
MCLFWLLDTVDSRFNDEKFCPSNNKVLKITPDLTVFLSRQSRYIDRRLYKNFQSAKNAKNTLLITMHENFQFASSEKISILYKCR